MDETTLGALESALAASPTNLVLRTTILRGWTTLGRHDDAARVAGALTPRDVSDPAIRREVARALVLGARAEAALGFVDGEDAETLVERARVLVAIGRTADARSAYERALAQNATLEDDTLARALTSRVPDVVQSRPGAPRLRVIANDDTDREVAAKVLQPEQPPVTFAQVGGLADVKAEIERRVVLPFQKPSLFARFKKRVGGGVLLYGPPGCGKTLLARATAGECKAKFLSVAISDVLDMYIGESERKLHAVFDQARATTPTVLFFDELEALAGKRAFSRDGVAAKIVSQFLAEMDGFAQNNHGVLVLGATNVPWDIDAAFRRPGRFDRVLFVPPPDREARRAVLDIHLHERPVAKDVDTAAIAGRTSGFSGADLEGLVETAADGAIRDSLSAGTEVPIAKKHLEAALSIVRATTVEWLSSARNYARYANEGGQYDEVLAFLGKHGKA